MIGRLSFFCLSLQHLFLLLMFPLQRLVASDEFSEIKVEVGASFLFVKKLFKLSIKLLVKIRFLISSK